MPIAIGKPHVVTWYEHVRDAGIATVVAIAVVGAFILDRRPPFEYISTEIMPKAASPGGPITVYRHVIWHRQCEGVAWTEIVGSDRIVTSYDRGSRAPFELGDVRASRIIILPKTIPPGPATYRGTIKFSNCGITSRWQPIEVPYQEVVFEVR